MISRSAMATQIAQIRSSACNCAAGAVTGTSSCDDIFKEKWDNVKANSQRLLGAPDFGDAMTSKRYLRDSTDLDRGHGSHITRDA
jgi:hypothetical protein